MAKKQCKYIFVTGGVVSSLGKGVTSSSIGRCLIGHGMNVGMLKLDPYINVDPGTMNPYQHGEVFVTEDGAETDLDLGHYERFTNQNMEKINNATTGQIYAEVISAERQGKYLGKTVQVIPHITNAIKNRIKKASIGKEIIIVEVGGTVGDIESLPFLEAIRQMKIDCGQENVMYVHVTLIPYLKSSDELKTKPTQHSVGKLREIGIEPAVLVCRTEKPLNKSLKEKMSLFCNVSVENIISALDVPSIYEVPLNFEKQNLDSIIIDELGLKTNKKSSRSDGLKPWKSMLRTLYRPKGTITIAIAGKYMELKDSYKSLIEALIHGGIANKIEIKLRYVDVTHSHMWKQLNQVSGILLPGGFGDRGIEAKIKVATYAREKNIPFFGICLGMQCIVIDVARHLCHLKAANSTEFAPRTKAPVVDLLANQKNKTKMGASMRLGSYPCKIKKGTLAYKIYAEELIHERHRHRYEFNNDYKEKLEGVGLKVSGNHTTQGLAEIVELESHPWFIGVQFHPELKSRPLNPHPLFKSFIRASL